MPEKACSAGGGAGRVLHGVADLAKVVGGDAARPFVPSAVDLANPNFLLSFGKVGRMVSASVSGMVSAQGVVQEMLTFADIGPVLHGEKLLVQRPEGGQPSHWMLTTC